MGFLVIPPPCVARCNTGSRQGYTEENAVYRAFFAAVNIASYSRKLSFSLP